MSKLSDAIDRMADAVPNGHLHAATSYHGLMDAAVDEIVRLRTTVDEVRREERERCIAIARGCTDYLGGYHGRDLDIYHHGMDTVLRVLSAPRDDMQARVVEALGREEVEHE